MTLTSARAPLWAALNELCPLHLAGSWDQVGPMVDPEPVVDAQSGRGEGQKEQERQAERIFLTIDLTEQVYEEAQAWGASVIIAYHPLLFRPLKRLTPHDAITRVAMRAVRDGVAIYSPHSALDAVKGGICDWLCELFEPFGVASSAPIEPSVRSPEEGAGRLITLREPQPLERLAAQLQGGLGLSYLRLAAADALREPPKEGPEGEGLIERVALCPGAGGGLFASLPHANAGGPQLLFTGEMSHHDVLGRVREGGAVLLTEHTRCERGYLARYAERLREHLPLTLCEAVTCSALDEDPLTLWRT